MTLEFLVLGLLVGGALSSLYCKASIAEDIQKAYNKGFVNGQQAAQQLLHSGQTKQPAGRILRPVVWQRHAQEDQL